MEHDTGDCGHQPGADIYHKRTVSRDYHLQPQPGTGRPGCPHSQRFWQVCHAAGTLPAQDELTAGQGQQQLGAAYQ